LAANGFRVFCPDQPGFGLADTRPEHHPVHGIFSHVEFLEEFVSALDLDRFFLAGNSMGCINTAHYVVRYPHRVERFALIAGPIGEHLPADSQPAREVLFWDGEPDTMRKIMSTLILNTDAVTDELIDMRVRCANLQKDFWPKFWDAFLNGMDPDLAVALTTKDRINRLNVPGICLYGRDDVLIPAEKLGYDEEDVLPDVQFFYPENCGHQGQSDQPEMFNQVFLEFFRDGRVSRKTAQWAGISERRPANPALVESG
jgi:pimeloyl-ACP methyl ester carboxylesterase